MYFTDSELKKIVNGQSVGKFYPYKDGTIKQIVNYIKELISNLDQSKILTYEVDFSSYGSGFASYVDIFVYKKGGRSTVTENNMIHINGITIYISKFAPIAVFGATQKTKHKTGGSYDFLECNSLGSLPKGNWDNEMYQINNIFKKYRIDFLDKKYMNQSLKFEIQIPTILNEGAYKVFDALFYWEN